MADAEAHAHVIVADVGFDRAQSIVAGIAAAGFDLDLARRQIEFVMEDEDVCVFNFEKTLGFADRAAAFIHESFGLQQRDPLVADGAFTDEALKFFAPWGKAMCRRDAVERHETDVVAVACVFGARIAEAGEELHGPRPDERRPAWK